MASLDVNQTLQSMLDAMKPVLGQSWGEVQQYARSEGEKLAKTLAQIQAQKLVGTITEQQASILFDMQKNASAAVLAAIKGIGEEAAARAWGAGLNAIKEPINNALGFVLLR